MLPSCKLTSFVLLGFRVDRGVAPERKFDVGISPQLPRSLSRRPAGIHSHSSRPSLARPWLHLRMDRSIRGSTGLRSPRKMRIPAGTGVTFLSICPQAPLSLGFRTSPSAWPLGKGLFFSEDRFLFCDRCCLSLTPLNSLLRCPRSQISPCKTTVPTNTSTRIGRPRWIMRRRSTRRSRISLPSTSRMTPLEMKSSRKFSTGRWPGGECAFDWRTGMVADRSAIQAMWHGCVSRREYPAGTSANVEPI